MKEYYTPDKEDLFLGYETEKITPDYSRFIDLFLPEGATKEEYRAAWGRFYCTEKFDSEPVILEAKELNSYLSNGVPVLRTPHLTYEQIIAEGWEDVASGVFKKGNYKLGKLRAPDALTSMWITFKYPSSTQEYYYYQGKCPSINEFRKICKLLNIK